jgi:hypothetical protein
VEAVPAPQRSTLDTPAHALAAVVENATALARAELRLGAAEARAWLFRIGFGLVLLWLSLLLAQVFVLLLALTPLLLKEHSAGAVGLMLALAFVPAVAAGGFAALELRRLKK